MVQGDDAQPPGRALGHEDLLQPLELRRAEAAAGQQRRGRQGRVEADQRQAVEAMDERPAFAAAGPAGPMVEALGRGHRHQRIVIARHQAERAARRERLEPGRRLAELVRQGEVGDVAGDDDMVDAGGAHVRGQRLEDLRPVQVPPAAPRRAR